MKMDGQFVTHRFEIPYTFNDDIYLGIASDIHFDSLELEGED